MRICMKHRNFIIYLLLAVLLVAGEGAGLTDKGQQAFQTSHTVDNSIKEYSLVDGKDLSTFQIIKGYQLQLKANSARSIRYSGNVKSGLFVLQAFNVPEDISNLNWESYILQGEQYVVHKPYQIVYMKNQDGRKRI